ncbi:MAG: hypothetical protein NT159_19065 [Proteobacteria bacterium]|nr:hypothetical protein [Pseudomonadota bacterium]
MKNLGGTNGKRGGFILIYVAAILVFLTALVLHSSRQVRGDAQVSARLQEHTATRDRLIAATTLMQARQAFAWAQAEPAKRNMSLFTDQPVDLIQIDGVNISISFQDADLQPDANQLTVAEWTRLLGAYGMAEAESQRLAERIDALRQQSGGFESIIDLANTPNLPIDLVQGFEASGGGRYPALVDLLTVGGESRRLHVANSPLPLFRAFNATQEQIGRLREVRRSREPTLADARLIFGSDLLKIIYEGRPEKLRARLEISGIPLRLEFDISTLNGRLVVTPPRILTAA